MKVKGSFLDVSRILFCDRSPKLINLLLFLISLSFFSLFPFLFVCVFIFGIVVFCWGWKEVRDHTFMTFTWKGISKVLKFVMCLRILLFLNNRSIFHFCRWWVLWGSKISHFVGRHDP